MAAPPIPWLPPGRLILLAALVGLLGDYLSSYLYFQGLVYLTAQFKRLILDTCPVFVMISAQSSRADG